MKSSVVQGENTNSIQRGGPKWHEGPFGISALAICDDLGNFEVSRTCLGSIRQRLFLGKRRYLFIQPEMTTLVRGLYCVCRRLDVRRVQLVQLLDKFQNGIQLTDEEIFLFVCNCKLSQLPNVLNFFGTDFHKTTLTESKAFLVALQHIIQEDPESSVVQLLPSLATTKLQMLILLGLPSKVTRSGSGEAMAEFPISNRIELQRGALFDNLAWEWFGR